MVVDVLALCLILNNKVDIIQYQCPILYWRLMSIDLDNGFVQKKQEAIV